MRNTRELRQGTLAVSIVMAFAVTASAAQLQLGAVQQIHKGPTLQFDAPITYEPDGSNAIKVTFNEGQVPSGGAMLATVLIDKDVPDSPFFGDYIANAINTLQLNIVSHEGYSPSASSWHLRGASGRNWYCGFSVAAVMGTVQTIAVPLTLNAGWWTTGKGDDKAGMFAEDLQNVTYVAIVLAPAQPADLPSKPKQSYTLDDVVVINDSGISSPPGSLTPLQRGLIARFGYGYDDEDKLTDEMKLIDTDGDGIPDWVEILAMWVFDAEIVSVDEDGVTVEWFAVRNQKYTVSRGDDLTGALQPVDGLIEIVADKTGVMTAVDNTVEGEGPFYYRVRRHVPAQN